jgi:hypothetical protein
MGWFKQIVKAGKLTYKAVQAANDAVQSASSKPVAQQPMSVPQQQLTAEGGFTSNPTSDYNELLATYKSYKFPDTLNTQPLIAKVNPHAQASLCPYCGVQHPFVAKRARQCPDCGKKMVVRSGVFLTEEQADRLESLIGLFYKQQSAWNQLGSELRNAQDARMSKRNTDYLLGIAQGFRHAAKFSNKKDARGFDSWDRSWGYFNQARVEEARQQDKYFNQLPRISYDMADMLVDQALAAKTEATKKRTLQRAAHQILLSMGESVQFEDDITSGTYAYERLKLIMQESGMGEADLDLAATRVAQMLHLNPQQHNLFASQIGDVKAYEIFGERILY